MIEVLENIDSTPKTIKLQKFILKDMMELEEPIPEIKKYINARLKLGLMLEKVLAFIYIDNVLCQKKVRLLLTNHDGVPKPSFI
jgi:hypothetical protein